MAVAIAVAATAQAVLQASAAAAALEPRPPPVGGAPPPRTVGAIVFFSAGLATGDLESFLAVAAARLEGAGVRPVVGAEADARVPPGGLPDYCAESAPCLRDAAGRLEVERLALLLLTGGGGRVRFEAVVADGATGLVLLRVRREAKLDTTSLTTLATELAASALAPPPGKLRVATTLHGAEILIAGAVVGRAPLEAPLDVSPGFSDVSVRRGPLLFTARVWVEGQVEKEVLLGVESEKRRGVIASPWLWAPIGLAVGLAVGVVVGFFVVPGLVQ